MIEKFKPENKEPKERMLKILFIDDDKEYLNNAEDRFNNVHDLVIAECHSVEEALQAIKENNPDIVFLDHQLTEGGHEGIETLKKAEELLKDKRIYSTTLSREMDVLVDYLEKNIEIIGKDLDKVEDIIEKE